MGLFNFFKKKSKEEVVLDEMTKMVFPGGVGKIRQQTEEVQKLLKNSYVQKEICTVLTSISMQIYYAHDKSSEGVIKRTLARHPKFSNEDAMIIYDYAVSKQFKRMWGGNDEPENIEDNIYYKSLGNNKGGATTDVIPGAYGEYGLSANNPIPANGINASETYLNKLKLISGEAFTWEWFASVGAKNIDGIIDCYIITTASGEKIEIYISPYQSVTSSTPPKGFYI